METISEIGTVNNDEIKLPGLEAQEEKSIELQGPTGPTSQSGAELERPANDLLENDDDIPILRKQSPTGPAGPSEEIQEETSATGPTEQPEEKPDDIFKMDEDGNVEEEEKPKPEYDFASLAQDLGLEFKEGGREEFKEAITKAIDTAKTMVEPDLSKFNPEQKILFNWLAEDGTLEDFFTPLKAFDDFLLKPEDEKVLDYLVTEEGLNEEKAKIRLGEIIDNNEFDDYVEKVDTLGMELRTEKFNEIIGTIKQSQENKQLEIQSQQIKEKGELAKVIDQTNTFMGMEIPQNVKDAMKRKVESGKLTIENNNAQTQILGHYFMLFGDKIFQKIEKEKKDNMDAGYNRGIRKVTERLHDAPPKPADAIGHGSRDPKNDDAKPLGNFTDIDKDAKTGFS